MRDRRAYVLVALLFTLQFGHSFWLNRWFNKNLADSIELTYQRMVRDEVPSNQRMNVISALENTRSYVSSYVLYANNMQFVLGMILFTSLITFVRAQRETLPTEVTAEAQGNRSNQT